MNSKASSFPEELIIEIVEYLVGIDCYNIPELLALNWHWYLCVQNYDFEFLMATTHLNGVNVSPHSLTNLLKDNDHLEIDLTDNYYDDRVLIQAHERDEDAEPTPAKFRCPIPALDFHDAHKTLGLLSIRFITYDSEGRIFTYDTKNTRALNLEFVNDNMITAMLDADPLQATALCNVKLKDILPIQFASQTWKNRNVRKMHINCDRSLLPVALWALIYQSVDSITHCFTGLHELHVEGVIVDCPSEENIVLKISPEIPLRALTWNDSVAIDQIQDLGKNLKVLDVQGTFFTNTDRPLPANMQLKYLAKDILYPVVTNEDLLDLEVLYLKGDDCHNELLQGGILDAAPRLKALKLAETSEITEEAFVKFVEARLVTLEEVVIDYYPLFSEQTQRWIAERIPKSQTYVTGKQGYEGDNDYSLLDKDTYMKRSGLFDDSQCCTALTT